MSLRPVCASRASPGRDAGSYLFNDGTLSLRAASVLFQGLHEAEALSGPEGGVFGLELGVGIGRCARLF
jgi:hypothetical protein